MSVTQLELVGVHAIPNSGRVAAVVGDVILLRALAAPAVSAVTTVVEPTGSGIVFTVGGLADTALVKPGYYNLSVTDGTATRIIELICFPSECLSIAELKYQSRDHLSQTQTATRRDILQAIAMHCTKESAIAALETTTPASPYYGLTTVLFGANSLANFGANYA